MPVAIRPAEPADFAAVATVIDAWWGRPVAAALPRLFLDHFHATSSIAEDHELAGFLVGFHSPGLDGVSYVHFAGVRPDQRRTGLARRLYGRFTDQAREAGSRELRAITGPSNTGSIRFHERLGFTSGGRSRTTTGPASR
ncbi:GNAT family N-acetyltransferase [Pseudonocardia sp. TRM90224]|uniref:GNAT family N-acetyltransferase n=1 Tax=Pseudonocardia sp. TRM90224 TaxID=2812678 RepID=UPI001E3B15C9|nr:GNAT family N-acetyltransferase [Pseudonocardia sp. TRM90224]